MDNTWKQNLNTATHGTYASRGPALDALLDSYQNDRTREKFDDLMELRYHNMRLKDHAIASKIWNALG